MAASTTSPGIDPQAVRAIVIEVLRRIQAGPSPSVPPSPVSAAAAALRLPGRVVSLATLHQLPAGTARVAIDPTGVVTPSAREYARDRGIVIERGSAPGGPEAARGPFIVAHAECGARAAAGAAALARAVPGAAQLPASGLVDVVGAFALHASRDAARGVLLAGRPALAAALANRSPSLRAVTARDPATLAAAVAECNANLLVVDPATFPAAALLRLASALATGPGGEAPPPLAARPAGCGCKGH